ncbi:malto-oligosyltrehalose synthase [Intrasporangium calvum]|uniref:malto-oligosyltrehalose synthase n=1 Tax=Intrasporangium calvum TaxID=53358 RepID=UPI000DF5F6AB|nr:malto-oligosyltrehalose synthase [Intrasporangium calvum]AXG12975.1 malto-oligosyltrehalose synthase [Intrasporangium calvum]
MSAPRRVVSTYRLQLGPDLSFDDAAAQVLQLADLGVSHLYLSPILQASAGSSHGYDVVDHSRLADGLGGTAGFDRLVAAAHGVGLGLVVDVVPNHMTTPVPVLLAAPLWSLLKHGEASPYAPWFDIDWAAQDGKVLWPVLGDSLATVLAAGDLVVDRIEGERGVEAVLRYFDHVLPLAPRSQPGDDVGRMPLGSLLAQQHYRLASWREASSALNYRRFFDVTSLIALRVEDPGVFDATHRVIIEAVRNGQVDGLRIDHPDGLADPRGYLQRLSEATGDAWTVVEKILEGEERLPHDWDCAGTTGYDALFRVGGLFVDPRGSEPLTVLSEELLGDHQDLAAMSSDAKRHVVSSVLVAEVERLVRALRRALPGIPAASARRTLEALLVGMDRYRIYVHPGEPAGPEAGRELSSAATRGAAALGQPLEPTVVDAVVDLALGRAAGVADRTAESDFITRFQQTCGPVMAKAVEDTTFYRFVRLVALNEVGGDPAHFGVSATDFHAFAERLASEWPMTMTTLSTHDTKRSEDVRARLAVLAERPQEWAAWVRRARGLADAHRHGNVDALTEYFLWQNVVGAWPVDADRLAAYATKAAREAKLHTSWVDGDPAYEEVVSQFAAGITGDAAVGRHVEDWLVQTHVESRANILGQKAVQLLMPGVPDVYQGTQLVDLSLVDPDNRRPVDQADRARRLSRLDGGGLPTDLSDEKLLVTAAALRLRRERPDTFVGERAGYEPLPSSSEHLVGFRRGDRGGADVCVLVTRLAGRLRDRGGWGDEVVTLPTGRWRDRLSAKVVHGGDVPLSEVLPHPGWPVAVLVRDDGRSS